MVAPGSQQVVIDLIINTGIATQAMNDLITRTNEYRVAIQGIASTTGQTFTASAEAFRRAMDAMNNATNNATPLDAAAFNEARAQLARMSQEEIANAENLRNIQRMGNIQNQAEQENIRRTQTAGRQQELAEQENIQRDRIAYNTQLAAQQENQRRAQTAGRQQERAIQEDILRSQQAIITGENNAIQATRNRKDALEQVRQQIIKNAAAEKVSYAEAAKGIIKSGGVFPLDTQDINKVAASLQKVKDETEKVTQSFDRMGKIGSYIFGTVLGVTAIGVMNKLIGLLKEFIDTGVEFQQAQFALEAGVRAMQNMGSNMKLEEAKQSIQELGQRYQVFSRKDITESFAMATLKLREFGFSKEQIDNVMNMSTTVNLLDMNNVSLLETTRGLTYAIGSGYFEALQRAGIMISRMAVAQKAKEMGYKEGYNSLSDEVRALVAYTLIMEQTSRMEVDAAKKSDQLVGKQKELAAVWNDFTTGEGVRLIPTLEIIYDWVIKITDGLRAWSVNTSLAATLSSIKSNNTGYGRMMGIEGGIDQSKMTAEQIKRFRQIISNEMSKDDKVAQAFMGKTFNEQVVMIFDKALEDSKKKKYELADLLTTVDILGDTDPRSQQRGRWRTYVIETEQAAIDLSKLYDKLEEERRKMWENLDDLDKKYTEKKVDIDLKFNLKLEDMAIEYSRKLEDIDRKMQESIQKENIDYQNSVADALRDAASKKEDLEADYRQKQIDAERDYQEKMLQLRNQFMFDLEGAIAARDALAVLRLTRKYKLDKAEADRAEAIRKIKDWEDYQRSLADLQKQTQEKLAELAREHKLRLQEIALQNKREREDALRKYEQDKRDLATAKARELADLEMWYGRETDAIKAEYARRVAAAEAAALAEAGWAQNAADAIHKINLKYYGPNSLNDRLFTDYVNRHLAEVARLNGGGLPNTIRPSGDFGYMPGTSVPIGSTGVGFASGGLALANKPTSAIFGEAGPELALFMPLNKLGSLNGSASSILSKSSVNSSGKIQLEVGLSPGLEYKIINNTLDRVAEVLISAQ